MKKKSGLEWKESEVEKTTKARSNGIKHAGDEENAANKDPDNRQPSSPPKTLGPNAVPIVARCEARRVRELSFFFRILLPLVSVPARIRVRNASTPRGERVAVSADPLALALFPAFFPLGVTRELRANGFEERAAERDLPHV